MELRDVLIELAYQCLVQAKEAPVPGSEVAKKQPPVSGDDLVSWVESELRGMDTDPVNLIQWRKRQGPVERDRFLREDEADG